LYRPCTALVLQEDEQYQEGKLRFTGGRGEQATYGAGDEDDAVIQRQIDRQERRQEQEEGSGDEGGWVRDGVGWGGMRWAWGEHGMAGVAGQAGGHTGSAVGNHAVVGL
jgi:hypothetical protein